MKEKLTIIDQIIKRHPACGVEKGWSYYVGGMTDSGGWSVRKMLDATIEDLQAFLDTIIAEESKPKKVYTEEEKADMKIVFSTPSGGFITAYQKKQQEKFYADQERKFFECSKQ